MIGSSFARNKPIIWETFGALFAKVIDMTRLYILIFFDIKKRLQIYLRFLRRFQEKRQRAYNICGSEEKNKLYTHKISGQTKTFRRAMLAHLQSISPSTGGTPAIFFLNLIFVGKKYLYVFFCIGASVRIG